MKKVKQITAFIGVILLAALYGSTLVLALIGNENSLRLLMAAIVCTIVIPILLWVYSVVFKLLKHNYSHRGDTGNTKDND